MKPASVSRRLAVKAGAKRGRADEYGAAQERGEFKWNGGERGNQFAVLPPQQMSASPAKKSTIRDAENDDPGIVRPCSMRRYGNGRPPAALVLAP